MGYLVSFNRMQTELVFFMQLLQIKSLTPVCNMILLKQLQECNVFFKYLIHLEKNSINCICSDLGMQ